MKNSLLPILAVCLMGSVGAWGEDPLPEMVEIEVHFVKATGRQMGDWFAAGALLEPSPNAVSIFSVRGILRSEETEKFLKDLRTAGAEVVSVPRAVTLSGRLAKVQNVRKFRYPIEYSEPTAESGKVSPLSFETKDVGISLEATPTVVAVGEIQLALTVQLSELVEFQGYEKTEGGKSSDDLNAAESWSKSSKGQEKVWQPIFTQREVTTQVSLYPEQSILLSDFNRSPNTYQNLILITVRTVPGS